jgi:putative ABC transport system permease protein
MGRLALRGLLAHRVRLAATVGAVVLGVGFVAGTYVLTDTLRQAITGVVGQSQTHVSVVVTGRSADATSLAPGALGAEGVTLPQDTLARVDAVPGVAAADAVVAGPVAVAGPGSRPVSAAGSATFALSVGAVPDLRVLTLRAGRLPTGADEAVLDAATADRAHVVLGERLRVAGAGAARTVQVVGLVGYGTSESLAGATIVGLTLPTTQAVLGQPGRLDEVIAAAAPGVGERALAARVTAALGPAYRVETQAQAVAADTAAATRGFDVFSDVLLVFAGIALFVAVFLIFNTFSILLAQRARELALLRCLGALRRQLVATVLGESLVIGAVASLLGVGVGVGLALGIRALLSSFGIDFPATAPVVEARTVVVSLVVGVVATVGAALVPAVRGSRTPPVAAMRDDLPVDTGRPAPFRLVTGTLLVVLGVGVVVVALHAGGSGSGSAATRAEVIGVGLALGFLGLSALIPLVARPLAAVLGWPFAASGGVAGRLGRHNAMRHPRRTAATAAALMIGLTLVTTIAVFAHSVQASTDASLQNGLHADFVVTPNGTDALSRGLGARLAGLAQLRRVAALESEAVQIELPPSTAPGASRRAGATGTGVAAYAQEVTVRPAAGRLSDVGGTGVAVTTGIADTWHLHIGSELPLGSVEVPRHSFTAAAIIHDPTGLTGDILFSPGGLSLLFPDGTPPVQVVLAQQAPGVDQASALAAVDRAVAAYPQAEVRTKAAYINGANQQFQEMVNLITVLLGLAVVIALFGIVNTLALSIVERRREIGLLRALGMSRRQVRAAVRWEAVVVSLLGTILGIAVGLAFGWVVVDSLRSQGVDRFAVPGGELVAFVVLAAVAGVLAAVLPARSAARVDVLAAITAE